MFLCILSSYKYLLTTKNYWEWKNISYDKIRYTKYTENLFVIIKKKNMRNKAAAYLVILQHVGYVNKCSSTYKHINSLKTNNKQAILHPEYF